MLYENKERIKQLLSEGLSIDGVAMLLECKKSTLCYWLYEKGILNSNK